MVTFFLGIHIVMVTARCVGTTPLVELSTTLTSASLSEIMFSAVSDFAAATAFLPVIELTACTTLCVECRALFWGVFGTAITAWF